MWVRAGVWVWVWASAWSFISWRSVSAAERRAARQDEEIFFLFEKGGKGLLGDERSGEEKTESK
jgi:hypothetical protein